MNAEQARTAIKSLGEFVQHSFRADDTVQLMFVSYNPGARDGKFHAYRYLEMPFAVYEEIKSELHP